MPHPPLLHLSLSPPQFFFLPEVETAGVKMAAATVKAAAATVQVAAARVAAARVKAEAARAKAAAARVAAAVKAVFGTEGGHDLVSVSSRLLPGPAPDQQTTKPEPYSTLSVMGSL